jgi:hypothetical protein
MAQKTFFEVCRRQPDAAEATTIQNLASNFVSKGYKLKRLFEETAVQPGCLGN